MRPARHRGPGEAFLVVAGLVLLLPAAASVAEPPDVIVTWCETTISSAGRESTCAFTCLNGLALSVEGMPLSRPMYFSVDASCAGNGASSCSGLWNDEAYHACSADGRAIGSLTTSSPGLCHLVGYWGDAHAQCRSGVPATGTGA